jgi:hypothetical protein
VGTCSWTLSFFRLVEALLKILVFKVFLMDKAVLTLRVWSYPLLQGSGSGSNIPQEQLGALTRR